MIFSNISSANRAASSRPLDPCTRRMMFGALRPIDYRPTLLDRVISRWNQLH